MTTTKHFQSGNDSFALIIYANGLKHGKNKISYVYEEKC